MVPSVAASVALTIADIEMFLAYRIFCTQCDFVSGFWSEKGSTCVTKTLPVPPICQHYPITPQGPHNLAE